MNSARGLAPFNGRNPAGLLATARGVLTGGDNAATEYFRRTSSDQLKIAFLPIVHDSISEVGVVKQHDQLRTIFLAVATLKSRRLGVDD